MIPFDFAYYRPATVDEAFACYHDLAAANKKPRYYAGGTETISMARVGSIEFGAIIDIKGIPACTVLEQKNGMFTIGSAQTLTNIAGFGAFPLLSDTVRRIADHTMQGKITLGGNLAGSIIYREAALPLMISNCNATLMTAKGLIVMPFLQIFDGSLHMQDGEFLVSVSIDQADLQLPYNHVKRTKMTTIDYPLITMAAQKSSAEIRAAISGYGSKPLLLPADILNDASFAADKKIRKIIRHIRHEGHSDLCGSREYKEFMLQAMLEQMLENFSD